MIGDRSAARLCREIRTSGSCWACPVCSAMGNTGPADAAVELFIRTLAAEIGPPADRAAGAHRPWCRWQTRDS